MKTTRQTTNLSSIAVLVVAALLLELADRAEKAGFVVALAGYRRAETESGACYYSNATHHRTAHGLPCNGFTSAPYCPDPERA